MKIGILGSGPLGVSLAVNFSKHQKVEKIAIYSRQQETVDEINLGKCHVFPNVVFSKKVTASKNLLKAAEESDVLFITVHSRGLTKLLDELSELLKNILIDDKFFIICTKGMSESGEFFHEIAMRELKTKNIGLFLGPSFASEIAAGDKTLVNLIHWDSKAAEKIANSLNDENTNITMAVIDDYYGAQICSIMKNIAAIRLGMEKGMGAKNDQIAVLFTNFVREMKSAIDFYGGQSETIFELCGIGDLFLTCTSFESRNYNFGYQLGRNNSVEDAFLNCGSYYPEGYYGLQNFHKMNVKNGLRLKICEELYETIFVRSIPESVLYEEKNIWVE